jgi:hypothetical protein
MDELGLFTAALGLGGPWRVTRSEFDAERTQLDLYLDFDRGARLGCPAKECAHGGCPLHDTAEKTWRPSGLLPAQGVLACPVAAGALPAARGTAGQCAVGASGVGVHVVVSRRWCLVSRR